MAAPTPTPATSMPSPSVATVSGRPADLDKAVSSPLVQHWVPHVANVIHGIAKAIRPPPPHPSPPRRAVMADRPEQMGVITT